MQLDDNGLNMNERVRHIFGEKLEIQRNSILPLRLLDVAHMMEDSLPDECSSDGIHFNRPKGTQWLNEVLQIHMNSLETDLVKKGQFTFGPPPEPSSFPQSDP